jgi:Peptidase family M28
MDQHLKSDIEPSKRETLLKLRRSKFTKTFAIVTVAFLVALSPSLCGGQTVSPQQTEPAPVRPAVHSHRPVVREGPAPTSALCASCVQNNLSYLAGPALHGRGSGTEDEHHAAQYIADKLKDYGLAPAAGDGEFIQTATIHSPLTATTSGGNSAKTTTSETEITTTWNVLGKIEGTGPKDEVILLSAHLDHLGVIKGQTYYGADDDASGTAGVMELARILAKGPKPTRTVIVALWGSEEAGFLGSEYFLEHPTFPLKDIVVNLEFEMIGRRDPQVKSHELWLSGWGRTDLGPELVTHGASLIADPHKAEKFFARSDNYALAKQGIIAQTVSSYGLHADYHQPTDTIAKIDFPHMDRAIASMIEPVTWLANSDFKPEWVQGKKP